MEPDHYHYHRHDYRQPPGRGWLGVLALCLFAAAVAGGGIVGVLVFVGVLAVFGMIAGRRPDDR